MVGRKSFLFFFLGWVFLPCLPPICLLHYVYLTLGGNRELDSSCPTFLCLYFQEIDWWRQTTSSTLIIFIHPIIFLTEPILMRRFFSDISLPLFARESLKEEILWTDKIQHRLLSSF
jgi:hypothetical protein